MVVSAAPLSPSAIKGGNGRMKLSMGWDRMPPREGTQKTQASCLVTQTERAPISQIISFCLSRHEDHILSDAHAKGTKGGMIPFK